MEQPKLITPCIEWPNGKDSDGYGRVHHLMKSRTAHKLAYETFIGLIPSGLQIDHLCRNRPCVNVLHMEPVTPAENTRRGQGPCGINGRKTHCPYGHPFAGNNLHISPAGRRVCLACRKEHNKRFSHGKRVAAYTI